MQYSKRLTQAKQIVLYTLLITGFMVMIARSGNPTYEHNRCVQLSLQCANN